MSRPSTGLRRGLYWFFPILVVGVETEAVELRRTSSHHSVTLWWSCSLLRLIIKSEPLPLTGSLMYFLSQSCTCFRHLWGASLRSISKSQLVINRELARILPPHSSTAKKTTIHNHQDHHTIPEMLKTMFWWSWCVSEVSVLNCALGFGFSQYRRISQD